MDELERKLRTTNLNLLPILRAVLKYRNLTQAAEALNITQSGVSNCLRQLRDHFDDELLVREGRALRLTEKGKQLREPLEQALTAVGRVMATPQFNPATSTRHFHVATADYVTAITAPDMARLMSQEAPGVIIQMLAARGRSAGDLHSGDIDMVISPRQVVDSLIFQAPGIVRSFCVESLGREPFVCMAHRDDKAFAAGLTVEDYLARPHASFHLDMSTHASLEHAYLLKHGVTQFNRILTSDFSVLPLIAAKSDCIVLVPRSLARLFVSNLPLQIGPSPLPIPDLELVMVFESERKNEPELGWLRSVLKRCAAAALDG